MAQVTFANVTITYPGAARPSVEKLDLEIADGEFLVLVGPSGCGKSTSLRALAGLEPVTEGKIFIGDTDVTGLEPAERDIAMVFQTYALYPHMSVRKNIGYPLKLAKLPKTEIDAKVAEAAEILGLSDLLDRKPKDLSGGQRQRVAMGRAIVRNPQVFLMDEPLSNLDAKLRVQTRTELAALQRRLGVTTVYVTHDQVEAMTMGDRVAVLKDGVLQQVASPRELYDAPANAFVAGFIGSPAMNLFPGNVNGTLTTIGVRPEHMLVVSHPQPGWASIPARVAIVEELGAESYVYATTADDTTLVAKLRGNQRLQPNEKITLSFNPNSAHHFDADTGIRQ
ncbi:MAG: ATP-binding cassette domain-containing protein [Corynebacterium sp.]|uniref:ABC transporter ATP-binding protein n=1 Tax=Corynebacterium sp. TaxID=1720 RepID=UPI0026DD7A1E|nr:ATP-binding cassette domain-containing protein [Corynebacterium sp.]MDO5097610.1 ATP-binding cassette domain-containing protein [Corynebacterium sp.]